MKKIYVQSVIVLVVAAFLPHLASAQNYFYSVFPILSTGNYSYSQPSGSLCAAPPVNTPEAMADNSFTNYAFYGGLVSAPLACDIPSYAFRAKLNLTGRTISSIEGYDAGFVIQTAAAGDIGNNIRINTYLNNTLQETATSSQLFGIDQLSAVNPSFIYFKTSKDFDEVEIILDESLIQLNILFETRVFFAQARSSTVLPVSIVNFHAALQNSNVLLSWTSANEDNVNHYNIERSNDGIHYTMVSTIKAKGTAVTGTNYSYADAAVVNGNYLYRIKSVDNDGSISVTSAVAITLAGKKNALIYPSVLSPGQQLWIRTEMAAMLTTVVYDMQGKMIKQERKISDGLTNISTTGLTAGTYLLKIRAAGINEMQFRFIVQ